jgi:predicted N-formylglutamate amidohydrolase
MRLIVSCEHGGNNIPERYKRYFNKNKDVLNSHLGYDLGALDVFKSLKRLSDYSNYSKTSRLLVELNRSLHHPKLFSVFIKYLPIKERSEIIELFYKPYRDAVEYEIKNYIQNDQSVVHVSVHSFTPVFNGSERNCDLGLLFDSTKKEEKHFCVTLKNALNVLDPNIKVRYNYPYLGKADGFTTYLRKKFPRNYLGIELEINQKFSKNDVMDNHLKTLLFNALKEQLLIRQ